MSALSNALRNRKASVIIAATGAAAAAVAATVVAAQPAAALPPGQGVCDLSTITLTPASGWVALTPLVEPFTTLSNVMVAEVTTDVGVVSGAEVRLGWAVNGAAPKEGIYGPANFANHQQFDETHTTFALINGLATGDTTVQPYVRVSGPTGATATVLHRCVVTEDHSD
jgi:hypothetical protein